MAFEPFKLELDDSFHDQGYEESTELERALYEFATIAYDYKFTASQIEQVEKLLQNYVIN